MTKSERNEFHRLAYYKRRGWTYDEEEFEWLLSLWNEDREARDAREAEEARWQELERQFNEIEEKWL